MNRPLRSARCHKTETMNLLRVHSIVITLTSAPLARGFSFGTQLAHVCCPSAARRPDAHSDGRAVTCPASAGPFHLDETLFSFDRSG
jgi:hypothetical protein